MDQGIPAIVYDCKYLDQTEVLAAHTARRGYSVSVSIFHKPANESPPFAVAGSGGGERVYEEYGLSREAGGV
ncbi:hypothetical protein PN498_00075 [Oscillatoria sp. CS-180]|uniref:hypothetical protein n=1 Tax=Oscillatoria sp. CS-180 TaxID=3021720 RepID=UPI00232FBF3D|nr:hypothetical protein [Oscillatoria sp. CS-180]MDB9524366.1 hypothetical protein [Oscillatoria sp. CS-180]